MVSAGALRVGDFALTTHRCEAAPGTAHAVIRPERVRIEEHGSAGENRVPTMVERVVFLGAATEVLLRLAPGIALQALMQNDGSRPDLTQGTPVHVYLPPDALRVLAGAPGRPGGRRGTARRELEADHAGREPGCMRACDHRGRVGAGRGCGGAGTGGGSGRGRTSAGPGSAGPTSSCSPGSWPTRPGQDRLPDPPGSRVVRRGVRARRRGGSRLAGRPGDRGHHARLRALPALRGRARPRLRGSPGGRHRRTGRARWRRRCWSARRACTGCPMRSTTGPVPWSSRAATAAARRRPPPTPGREADPGLRAGHHRAADHGVRHRDGGRGAHLGAGQGPGGTGRGLRRLRVLDGR